MSHPDTDTARKATGLPFALTRPIHVAEVGLRAHDVEKLAEYYRALLGLETLAGPAGTATLGAGGVPFLVIEPASRGAPADDTRQAGLFHTAFLMPSRADLARWILHASETRVPVDGTADHLVSEAIYLTDPEGNGIEVYADRPAEAWAWDGDTIRMATDPLDVNAIVGELNSPADRWQGAPEFLRIGHIHLRVGDARAAAAWWQHEVGLEQVTAMPSASFLSSGRYHHHVGANSWQSRGAGPRDPARAGLAYVTLAGTGIPFERELSDPWGTRVRLRPGG
ncbi:glyoxalase/bleomycin resistance protein/dioxygenase [Kaistia sp. 32K]|uniref:VOC family protein n=1 Tax=Kaistia sp. 32K TaxID=2795690 RepID=UPI0019155E3B|nr:VOC family protein [Kaistia sp. 32K]BCP54644.1 glyoxalase/bleomycin resistance protein/dioxygenase [Kaistia sp. 32K]